MSKRPKPFKRMVLGLPHSAGDYAAVHAAADLAELLGIDLLATFIEDTGLRGLAELPGMRELQPLGAGWRPLDTAQLAKDLDSAARTARRLFVEATRTCRFEARFDVARGTAAEIIASMAHTDDILVVIEPKNPAERITQQFTALIDAALKSASAVLLMPSRVARQSGPVVAVALSLDDPSVPTALAIAAATREHLVVLGAAGRPVASPDLEEAARAIGVPLESITPSGAPIDGRSLAAALAPMRERLIVMTRGAFADVAASVVASLRAIPVLIVEPAKPEVEPHTDETQ